MKKFLLLLSVVVFSSAPLMAWGPKGHDVVAYIAEQHLSKRAKRNVEAALGGYSMVYVANWMDNASHTEEYEHTKTWHYVNVDHEEGSYLRSKKEPKGDVSLQRDAHKLLTVFYISLTIHWLPLNLVFFLI